MIVGVCLSVCELVCGQPTGHNFASTIKFHEVIGHAPTINQLAFGSTKPKGTRCTPVFVNFFFFLLRILSCRSNCPTSLCLVSKFLSFNSTSADMQHDIIQWMLLSVWVFLCLTVCLRAEVCNLWLPSSFCMLISVFKKWLLLYWCFEVIKCCYRSLNKSAVFATSGCKFILCSSRLLEFQMCKLGGSRKGN